MIPNCQEISKTNDNFFHSSKPKACDFYAYRRPQNNIFLERSKKETLSSKTFHAVAKTDWNVVWRAKKRTMHRKKNRIQTKNGICGIVDEK